MAMALNSTLMAWRSSEWSRIAATHPHSATAHPRDDCLKAEFGLSPRQLSRRGVGASRDSPTTPSFTSAPPNEKPENSEEIFPLIPIL
jgi:hypothetical protein